MGLHICLSIITWNSNSYPVTNQTLVLRYFPSQPLSLSNPLDRELVLMQRVRSAQGHALLSCDWDIDAGIIETFQTLRSPESSHGIVKWVLDFFPKQYDHTRLLSSQNSTRKVPKPVVCSLELLPRTKACSWVNPNLTLHTAEVRGIYMLVCNLTCIQMTHVRWMDRPNAISTNNSQQANPSFDRRRRSHAQTSTTFSRIPRCIYSISNTSFWMFQDPGSWCMSHANDVQANNTLLHGMLSSLDHRFRFAR